MIRNQLFRGRSNRLKEILLVSLFIIILVLLKPTQGFFGTVISEIFRPFTSFLTYTSQSISQYGVNFFQMREIAGQAESLKSENTRLKEQLLLLEGLQRENFRLKQLLSLSSSLSYDYVAGRTIARAPDRWFDRVRLNVGSRQGIKINHIVINQNGLVGKIIETSPSSSLVQLVSDPKSAVACVTEHGQFPGVLAGLTRERGQLTYLQNHAVVKLDEKVFTSGMGGIFPKGLLVGVVEKTDKSKNKPVPEVFIKLSAIEQSIDEVLILKTKI